jgi:hypothetical protein
MTWSYFPNSRIKKYDYDHPDDVAYWKAYNERVELLRSGNMSNRKKKKSGFDQEQYSKDLATNEKVRADLDASGINERSVNIRKYETRIAKGWGDYITENILKHLKAGTNTSRRSESNPMGRGGERGIEGDSVTKGEQSTGLFTSRGVSAKKSGGGDEVQSTRSQIRTKLKSSLRRKTNESNRTSRDLDRAKSRLT